MIMNYALDTYSVFNFSKDEVFNQFASSGRFITAFIGKFIKILNISETGIYLGSSFLALLFLILSIFKLNYIIKNDIKNKFIRILISFIIIINPFSIELWLYIEKGIMWLSVFFSICAVEQVVKFFETKMKRHFILGIIYMFLANCSYQGAVGIFASISLIYIIKYSKSVKEFIINNSSVAVIYGIPALIDLIIMKVFYSSNRLRGQILLSKSISKILNGIKEMFFETYGLLPKYLFFSCICFTFAIFCCKIIMGENVKNRIKYFLEYFYIIFGTILIAILPQIIQPSDSIWFVPRSTYSFGSVFGILNLYYLLMCKNIINNEINKKIEEKSKNNIEKIMNIQILLVSTVMIISMAFSFYKILSDRFLLNQIDKYISIQIENKIKKYEKETGNKITKIEIYEDQNLKFTYDDIYAIGDINIKAYYADWSTKAIIEYYLKRKLKYEKESKEFKYYFSERNWNEFNINEQIFLEEDRIIICKY